LVSHIVLVSVQIVFASYKLTQNPLIGLLSYSVLPYSFQCKGQHRRYYTITGHSSLAHELYLYVE
jgi:hypothetical protein